MIKWIEDNTGKFLLLVVGAAFIAPRLLTLKTNIEWLHFNDPVGDTIGGITAPILNLAGIILLYLTLKKQNEAFQNQRDYDIISKHIDNINTMYLKASFTLEKTEYYGDNAYREVFFLVTDGKDYIKNNAETAIGSFLFEYNVLKMKLLSILNKNRDSRLIKIEQQFFYDETFVVQTSLITFNKSLIEYFNQIKDGENAYIKSILSYVIDEKLEEKINSLMPIKKESEL
jgi:hypothetical protein